jgi:hypothetical protein
MRGKRARNSRATSLRCFTVHLISILEMLRACGVAAMGDAARQVEDDDNGRGGMSMMRVMVSGIN